MQSMINEKLMDEWHQKLTQELRRGVLVLAALSQLDDAQYGYDLMRTLNDRGLEVDQGTLYPLLRRLEEQGFLESEWRIEGSRPRRYYRISPLGRQVYHRLAEDWRELTRVMNGLLPELGAG